MEKKVETYWELWQKEKYGDVLEDQKDHSSNNETGNLAEEQHPELSANDNTGRSQTYWPETLNLQP